jgi:hypothetical protein
MGKYYAIVVFVMLGGGSAMAQTPAFQPNGEDQLKATTLYQQAVIEIRNMQVAQLQFDAAEKRLQEVRAAQRAHEPALLKSVGAEPGSGWDWDRMVVRVPPPVPTAKPPEKPTPPVDKK